MMSTEIAPPADLRFALEPRSVATLRAESVARCTRLPTLAADALASELSCIMALADKIRRGAAQ